MGIFGNKKQSLPAFLDDEPIEQPEAVNYNSVVDWLTGLSVEDYAKVIKISEIYREANAKTCGVLGVENGPTTFITEPEPEVPEQTDPDKIVDDELAAAFLEDEPKKPQTKVQVKDK